MFLKYSSEVCWLNFKGKECNKRLERVVFLLCFEILISFLRIEYGYHPYIYPSPFLLAVLGYDSFELRRNFPLIRFVLLGTVGT